MKKRIIATLLLTGMVLSLAACGANEQGTKQEATQTEAGESQPAGVTEEEVVQQKGIVSTKDFDPDAYVTIGDFSQVSVETNVYTFTEEDVLAEIDKTVDYFLEYTDSYNYTPTDKQVVEEGDIVNLDYCGKKDGEAFEGGTAKGAHLEIGSNRFIDGFETGLIGHSIGESFDLPLKFPDNYGQAELAGKDVVFEITLNSIDTREKPELNDNLVQAMDIGFATLADLQTRIREDIQGNCDDRALSENRAAVWEQVLPLCDTKDAPQELVDEVMSGITQSAEYYAQYYSVTVEEFIEKYMGMTKDEYDKEMLASAQQTAKERMAIAAIAKKAGITLSDEDVKKAADEQCANLGYNTGDDLLTDLGTGYFYDYLLSNQVKDYLLTQVTVKENAPVSLYATAEAATDTDANTSQTEEAATDSDANAMQTEEAATDSDDSGAEETTSLEEAE